MVSDFYAAYDAINCPQQKCLIHFIRDLNEALLKHPYDVGLKRLANDFAGVLKPIVETVDRRGLKKHFLGKHRSSVYRFYNRISDCLVTSEAAEKLVSRLQKNRNKMFTFLDFDDVPWNNNNAEHAVKAFASVRRVIEGPTTEKGLRDFLVLLSICETCKYRNVDFLEFLRSGTKDIDDFETNGWKQRGKGEIREWIVKWRHSDGTTFLPGRLRLVSTALIRPLRSTAAELLRAATDCSFGRGLDGGFGSLNCLALSLQSACHRMVV